METESSLQGFRKDRVMSKVETLEQVIELLSKSEGEAPQDPPTEEVVILEASP
ncbi:hypothetical protein MCBRY_001886 [Methylocystis bryophila]